MIEKNNTDSITSPAISSAMKKIEELRKENRKVKTAPELENLEQKIVEATDQLASAMIQEKVQRSLDDPELKREASCLVKSFPKKLKNQGIREVRVRPWRGPAFWVSTNYYSEQEKKKENDKRSGFYPALIQLGIHDHCTPTLASDISMCVALTSSFDEAAQVLAKRGLIIDKKRIREISLRFAARVRAFQRDFPLKVTEQDNLVDRRVVISTDGGRIRIRKDKNSRTKKGRLRYSTKWREPKLLIIYTIDDNGQMDRSFAPFIDGTMGGPDEIFALMSYYLFHLQVKRAKSILFVADGAKWIWKRIPLLMSNLGLHPQQYYELFDFYHVVEHLAAAASVKWDSKSSQRKQWIKEHRKMLLNGETKQVIKAIHTLLPNGKTKALTTELNYFIKNEKRMNYAQAKKMAFPLGSGAMESAIRRVINLKLKGAAIFWKEEHANGILLLRSFFKAGRWPLLNQMAFTPNLYP